MSTTDVWEKGWKNLGNMNPIDKYMLFMAIFGKAFLVLQIIKIIVDKSSESVSFIAYVLYFVVSISWILFGVHYQETIVTTSSFIGLVFSLVAMIVVLLYKDNKSDIF